MMPKISFLLLLFLLAGGPAGSPTSTAAEKENYEARRAAEDWLALVDDERYNESYGAASGYFRKAISLERWVQSLSAHRRPMGRKLARKLLFHKYTTTLPGAPDGEYVVIQYQTSFENKKAAVETVTPMREADGVWRVSGYFIR